MRNPGGGRLVVVATRDEPRRRSGDSGPLDQVSLSLTSSAADAAPAVIL